MPYLEFQQVLGNISDIKRDEMKIFIYRIPHRIVLYEFMYIFCNLFQNTFNCWNIKYIHLIFC